MKIISFLVWTLIIYFGIFIFKKLDYDLQISTIRKHYDQEIRAQQELGYFYGQCHALSNDFRICYNEKLRIYEWSKIPFDNNSNVVFNIKKYCEPFRLAARQAYLSQIKTNKTN